MSILYDKIFILIPQNKNWEMVINMCLPDIVNYIRTHGIFNAK